MDYEKLAKQFGGVSSQPSTIDYSALAAQMGGVSTQSKEPEMDETARLAARFPAPASAQIPGYGKPVPAAKKEQNLSLSQLLYRNIAKPVLAPTVEAMGAVGGGLLGTPMGPPGIVGGAGLGYGMAKEALKLGDIYLGGMTPEQAQTQPVKNILEGATYEAGGRVVGQAVSAGIGKVVDLFNAPAQKAATLAQLSLGKDLPDVLNALKNAPPNASVAEITASFNNPKWQALIDDALQQDPQFLRKVKLFNEEESLKALSKLVGGESAAEVRSVAEKAKDALNAITTPSREAALNRANLGKAVAEYEAKAGVLSDEATAKVADVRRLVNAGELAKAAGLLELIKKGVPVEAQKYTYTYKGALAQMADDWASQAANASLDLGQGARFAQGAADALRSVGIKPLEGLALSKKIATLSNNPQYAGNDLIEGSVRNVADDIAKWTDSNGIIDNYALNAIRINSVNAAIQKLRPGMDATAQRNLASGVLTKIKPFIDDAIEEAGGVGWKKYLADYSKGMEKIAERKLSGEALKLWKTNKDGFVRLVQNESPEEVERILGPGKYNIATELADSSLSVLRDQAQKRLTQVSIGEQVKEGQAALAQLLKQQTSFIRLPSYLSVVASSTNKVISELERAVSTKTLQTLTEAMKTPRGAANLLSTLPAAERSQVLRLLADPSQWSPTLSSSATFGFKGAFDSDEQ